MATNHLVGFTITPTFRKDFGGVAAGIPKLLLEQLHWLLGLEFRIFQKELPCNACEEWE
jgi:hypothetical protein